ncbi:MAG: 3' terminal RNA ribose 2'-O-methyltransferase Hen1 [Myxococcales bacterium]|nr:3' terminal RNA ribose 2'-O-methyltransferase Hen1 [Myxococcales bacterium]
MLLTLTSRQAPATDLGHLLSKHPDRCQTFDLAYGRAHVFYPEASPERCTAALLLDLDPVGLVRGRRPGPDAGTLAQYVNDRPYIGSSFLSVAIAQVFRTALKGNSKSRPELAQATLPLEATVSAVPSRSGEGFLRGLFEPLGYQVDATRVALDERFDEWGPSPYFELTVRGDKRVSELLSHLYVLLPVLDGQKHYWVGQDEVDKMLAHGAGWLEQHPLRELILRRGLKHKRRLFQAAMERLLADDDAEPEETEDARAEEEAAIERPLRLDDARRGAVQEILHEVGATRVIDLGCGEGRLMAALLKEARYTLVAGMDVSARALEIAAERLHLDDMSERKRARVQLFQGALTYRDERLKGFDAACLIEVIEHLDPPRLEALERVVFGHAAPPAVVVTTPNVEHNVLFEGMPAGRLRHRDHRFEWTRAEFQAWASQVAARHHYEVRFGGIGADHPEHGPPTQVAVFTRGGEA